MNQKEKKPFILNPKTSKFKMKFALDIRKIGRRNTGDEIYITNLVQNLSKIDQTNSYLLLTDSFEGESLAKRILKGIGDNFKIISITPSKKIFWTLYTLPKFLKKNNVDLAHVQYITPQSLPSRIKLVTTIHDVSFKMHPEYIQFKDRLILNWFIPKSIKKANHIISVSNFTKDEIQKAYPQTPSEKITTVYNGINKQKFQPLRNFNTNLINKIRKKFNLFDRFILHVSSMQPRKNIPSLIEAFQKYINYYKDENTVLVIGGEKSHNYDKEIDKLLQNAVLREKIKMIGYVREDELPILYALSSLYVSPSIYEGFDLPLAEVMQSEVPVMASDLSCHKEIVQDGGILFDPQDTDNFANKINKALNNEKLRQKLIKNALLNIERFEWENCARETLQIYEGLAGRNNQNNI